MEKYFPSQKMSDMQVNLDISNQPAGYSDAKVQKKSLDKRSFEGILKQKNSCNLISYNPISDKLDRVREFKIKSQ